MNSNCNEGKVKRIWYQSLWTIAPLKQAQACPARNCNAPKTPPNACYVIPFSAAAHPNPAYLTRCQQKSAFCAWLAARWGSLCRRQCSPARISCPRGLVLALILCAGAPIVAFSEATSVAIFPTKEARSFIGVRVIFVLFHQRPIGCPVVRWLDPVARYHTRQRNADRSGTIKPRGPLLSRKTLAQALGKVVAVFGEKVVGRAGIVFRGRLDYLVDLMLGCKGESLQDLGLEGAARRNSLRCSPVDTCCIWVVMTSVGVLASVDDDAGMEEGGPESP